MTRGRPAIGSSRRTSIGGRNMRPKRRKRGAKSTMRMVPLVPSIDGLQDGGVGQVALAASPWRRRPPTSMKPPCGLVAAQQRIEHRIAVEPAEAMPDMPAVAIDQAGNGAVADDAEIEAAHGATPAGAAGGGGAAVSCAPCRASARRAPAPDRRRTPRRRAGPAPPKRRAMLMPASSVKSSPTKIGRRPWNGACAIRRSTAWPLDAARRPISTASRAGIRRNHG